MIYVVHGDVPVYVTIYTKEEGKQELTYNQWWDFDLSSLIYHREDGPAIEYSNGDKYWFINGKLHREDGPAIEYSSGDKEWYINGKFHREDGPAIEYSNGDKFCPLCWYVNDKNYSKIDYNKLLKEVDLLEPILGLIDPRDWVRKRFERNLLSP